MKRSGFDRGPGPERHTPLVARSELARTSALTRSTPIPRVFAPREPRPTPPRKPQSREQRDLAAQWALIRAEAWGLWSGRCAVRGDPLPWEQCHGHHRLMKSAGGPNTLVNCLPVCARCHERIHRAGDAAYDAGWLVRSWLDPADVPVLTSSGPVGDRPARPSSCPAQASLGQCSPGSPRPALPGTSA